jgi:hypothetical protein
MMCASVAARQQQSSAFFPSRPEMERPVFAGDFCYKHRLLLISCEKEWAALNVVQQRCGRSQTP